MLPSRASLAVLLLVAAPGLAPCPAQAPLIRTTTAVGVLSGTSHTFIPAGTFLSTPATRSVSGVYFGCPANASVTISRDGTQGMRIRGRAYGYAPLGWPASVSAGTT